MCYNICVGLCFGGVYMIKPISLSSPCRRIFMTAAVASLVTTGCSVTKHLYRPKAEPMTPVNVGNIMFHQSDLSPDVPINIRKRLFKPDEYTVTLSDGTVVKYNENQSKNANIIIGKDMGYTGDIDNKCVQFNGCNLKSIKGTDNRDYYYLRCTNAAIIDLGSNKGLEDEIRMNNSTYSHIYAKDSYIFSNTKENNVNEGWIAK